MFSCPRPQQQERPSRNMGGPPAVNKPGQRCKYTTFLLAESPSPPFLYAPRLHHRPPLQPSASLTAKPATHPAAITSHATKPTVPCIIPWCPRKKAFIPNWKNCIGSRWIYIGSKSIYIGRRKSYTGRRFSYLPPQATQSSYLFTPPRIVSFCPVLNSSFNLIIKIG